MLDTAGPTLKICTDVGCRNENSNILQKTALHNLRTSPRQRAKYVTFYLDCTFDHESGTQKDVPCSSVFLVDTSMNINLQKQQQDKAFHLYVDLFTVVFLILFRELSESLHLLRSWFEFQKPPSVVLSSWGSNFLHKDVASKASKIHWARAEQLFEVQRVRWSGRNESIKLHTERKESFQNESPAHTADFRSAHLNRHRGRGIVLVIDKKQQE